VKPACVFEPTVTSFRSPFICFWIAATSEELASRIPMCITFVVAFRRAADHRLRARGVEAGDLGDRAHSPNIAGDGCRPPVDQPHAFRSFPSLSKASSLVNSACCSFAPSILAVAVQVGAFTSTPFIRASASSLATSIVFALELGFEFVILERE